MCFHKFKKFHKLCDPRFSLSEIAMGAAKWFDRKANNPQPNVLTSLDYILLGLTFFLHPIYYSDLLILINKLTCRRWLSSPTSLCMSHPSYRIDRPHWFSAWNGKVSLWIRIPTFCNN